MQGVAVDGDGCDVLVPSTKKDWKNLGDDMRFKRLKAGHKLLQMTTSIPVPEVPYVFLAP